jgi:Pentapeptide repeats (9 copies)
VAKNETIYQLLFEKDREKYDILFEPKISWYLNNPNRELNWNNSHDKIEKFNEALKLAINLMHKDNLINLSYIHFPPFTFNHYKIDTHKKISFEGAYFHDVADFRSSTFTEETDFSFSTFNKETDFQDATFYGNAQFWNTTFNGEAKIWKVVFIGEADFWNATFTSGAYFRETVFCDEATFHNATFNKIFSLYQTKITKLNLLDAKFDDTNLLSISAYDDKNPNGKTLTIENFADKETIRLIKGHLDSHNNITESNKYFALEQEYYLHDLLNETFTEPNRWQTIIALILNKYVSNYGTDWLRSLIVLIITGYIVMIGYMAFDAIGWLHADKEKMIIHFLPHYYIPYALSMIGVFGSLYLYTLTSKDRDWLWIAAIYLIWSAIIVSSNSLHPWDFSCYIVQITNPIGAFKDVELYKGIEFYATIVRITVAIMIYQLIVAFRNNTRRA